MTDRKLLFRLDWILLLAVLAHLIFGMLMVDSVSEHLSVKIGLGENYFVHRHLAVLGFSLVVSVLIFRYWNFEFIQNNSQWFFVPALVLIALPLTPGIGLLASGARRWFALGPISLYATPLASLCALFFLSGFLAQRAGQAKNAEPRLIEKIDKRGYLRVFLCFSILFIAGVLQPDFAGAAVLFLLGVFMTLAVGKYKSATLICLVVLAACVVSVISSGYRLERLTAFMDPWAEPFATTYQLSISLISIGSGNFLGSGVGLGQMHPLLPEAHSNFIFATIVEELGAVGAMVVIGLSLTILWRCFCISRNLFNSNHYWAGLFTFGAATWISLLSIFHISVTLGLLPTFGYPYPFMSYGNSALFSMVVVIAIVLKLDFSLCISTDASSGVTKRVKALGVLFALSYGLIIFSTIKTALFNDYLDHQYMLRTKAYIHSSETDEYEEGQDKFQTSEGFDFYDKLTASETE